MKTNSLIITLAGMLIILTGCWEIEVDVCTYDGKTYIAGAQFSDVDGCNSCFCSDDGGVGCTEMACY